MSEIAAINLVKRFAVLTDDRVVPITNLFDIVGDDTNDPAIAVSFVAGAGREWFACAVTDFETTRPI